MRGKKGLGMPLETVGYWIIALAVLVIILTVILFLKGRGISAIDYIKDLIRFGR